MKLNTAFEKHFDSGWRLLLQIYSADWKRQGYTQPSSVMSCSCRIIGSRHAQFARRFQPSGGFPSPTDTAPHPTRFSHLTWTHGHPSPPWLIINRESGIVGEKGQENIPLVITDEPNLPCSPQMWPVIYSRWQITAHIWRNINLSIPESGYMFR